MATAVAPELDNPDIARNLLKALYDDEQAGTPTVCPLHQLTRAQDLALAPFLDELNRTRTVSPGAQLRVVSKTLSDDKPCPTSSRPCLDHLPAAIPSNQSK